MEDLVVVEDDDGGVMHDELVHLAVEGDAAVGVGGAFGEFVELVVLGVAVAGVVGSGRAAVAAVEEREVVLGIGVVGYPTTSEPAAFALRYLLTQCCGGIDVDFDVDA